MLHEDKDLNVNFAINEITIDHINQTRLKI